MVAQRWWGNLFAATSVLAALLTIVFILPAIDRAVPASVAAAATKRHDIAAGISVLPPTGGLLARAARSGSTSGSVLYLVGPARYVVSVRPYDGDLAGATAALKTRIQGMRGYQATSGDIPLVTRSGIRGLTGGFTAPGRIGRYAVFTVPGRTIEVTVTGSEGDLGPALDRIDESIASIADGGDS
jgi:hypothetical protein